MKRIIIILLIIFAGISPVYAVLDGYNYYIDVTLTNSGSDLTNPILKFNVYNSKSTSSGYDIGLSNHAQSDYDDVRFTSTGDVIYHCYFTRILAYHDASYSYYVEVPSIPSGTSTLRIQYGNATATSVSNGADTFSFFDEFDSYDASKWGYSGLGTVAISDSSLVITGTTTDGITLTSDNAITGDNKIVVARVNSSHYQDSANPEIRYYTKYFPAGGDVVAFYSYPSVGVGRYYRNRISSNTYTAISDFFAGGWVLTECLLYSNASEWRRGDTGTKVTSNYPTGSAYVRIVNTKLNGTFSMDFIGIGYWPDVEPTRSYSSEYWNNLNEDIFVYSYGSNFVIWDIGNYSTFYLDGKSITASHYLYGQYNLTPGTQHIACSPGGNCTGIVTEDDTFSVIEYWGVYLLLIGMCIACYRFPVTAFPAVIYSVYLLNYHLPGIGASFNEYIFVAVLMVMALLSGYVGLRMR